MRISDWSSDMCSSDLTVVRENYPDLQILGMSELQNVGGSSLTIIGEFNEENASLELVMPFNQLPAQARNLELVVPCLARTGGVAVHYDRTSVVKGKSVSVRVDLGGRRIIKKKK